MRDEARVPTEVSYHGGKFSWGYDIPLHVDAIRWLWFLLLTDRDLEEGTMLSAAAYFATGNEVPIHPVAKGFRLRANQVMADYLRGLWDHSIASIAQSHGESFIKNVRFHAVITLPAAWQERGRRAIENAAGEAGIMNDRPAGATQLSIVPRPMATALATLGQDNRLVRQGELYTVCYLGSRRADVQTYQVIQVSPVILQRVLQPTWGTCPGDQVENGFESLLRSCLGDALNYLSQADVKEVVTGEWQIGIKPAFQKHGDTKKYYVNIPAHSVKNPASLDSQYNSRMKNGRLQLSSADIEQVFAEYVSTIRPLIWGQMQRICSNNLKATGILAAGGLGSNPYLYDLIKDTYQPSGYTVLHSYPHQTAACWGAIYHGLVAASQEHQIPTSK
ncbi:hypothetical protein BDW59DRAFT_9833 [Aspergillus cavernicola]|uniref:Actin-like ATPase domain-containing protein n=1 Tax=Aspergillus cavernicola TaxID=176166 RepID=A0ABR4HPG0_9EURO